MANFKIMRNGLNTEIVGDPHIGQSSEDITVAVTDDGTYTGYEKKLYYSYGYRNQIYRAIADKNSSGEFIIPMTAFLEPGIVKLSLELSNGTNKPTCNACFISVTNGAKSVAASDILPDDATWEQYVASYVKSHADTLKGEKGDKGDTGAPGVPTDEQTQKAVNSWLTEHPEATTTVVDGSVTPKKTDFLTHVKSSDEWRFTTVGNGYLGVATNEYLDIQGLEKLIVLVRDTNYNAKVYLACYDESQIQLQAFTVANTDDDQRLIDTVTVENTGRTINTTKTVLNLANVCVEGTRYIKVKVAQYRSTDDSSISIYTSEYYNGENYVEWNDKYENRLIKDNSIQLKHTDFVTYNNPNLIDVTNIKSTLYTTDTSDLTHPYNQFGEANQLYIADYIDVRENKSLYIRTVRNADVNGFPYNVACYDSNKNFISNKLATTTIIRKIGGLNNTVTMEDGYKVVNRSISVHKIDLPSEVSFVRLGVVLANNVNAYDVKYILVSYEDILSPLAIAETYEKIISNDWKEAVKECLNTSETKTMVMIGDSLTNWGGGDDEANGFLKIVHDKTSLVTKNEGLAGATWQNVSGQTACGVQRIDTLISENRKYDLYCFLLGTNGGSNTDTGETSADTSTMCGAIRYCMEKLKAYDPTAIILVLLPPQRAEGNDNQEKVNAVIKSIVNSYGVKTLDIYHESGIVPNTKIANVNYLSDGLHLNKNGYTVLGNILSSEIKYLLCI